MAFDPSSKDDLVELWRRLFPPGYTVPIEDGNNGQGLDVFSQQAAQFAEGSDALNESWQALFLKPHSTQTASESTGEVRSAGSVAVSRAAPADGPIEVAVGTLLRTEVQNTVGDLIAGPRFRLAADLTIPAGSLGPVSVSVEAERPGPQSNMPAGTIVGFELLGRATVLDCDHNAGNFIEDSGSGDRFSPGMLGQFVTFAGLNAAAFARRIIGVTVGAGSTTIEVDGPALLTDSGFTTSVLEFEDLLLSVLQAAATVGGRHGELDAIGRERRLGRSQAEADPEYRDRLCRLSDIISPAAIVRIAHRILDPLGVDFLLKETRDPATLKGMVWDFDPFDFGSISDGNVLLADGCGDVRFFILCVGFSDEGDFGAFYDATTAPNANAWDEMFFDGFAVDYASALSALWQSLNEARAAGVCFEIVQDLDL